MEFSRIAELAEQSRPEMIAHMLQMCAIPAVNPAFGGTGEYQRCMWLLSVLKKNAIAYELIRVPDDTVAEGERLNIIVRFAGSHNREKTVWLISHTDTVGPGNLDAWSTDPYQPVEKDGRIYSLGSEDNGQAVIGALQICLLMQRLGLKTRCNTGFIFCADEEDDNSHGLEALIVQNVFGPHDEALVPDAGSSDGSFIEIAEKSLGFIRFTISGKQAHAAMPHLGINAFSASCRFVARLEDTLKAAFPEQNPLYDPPGSTFEPTQTFANVESGNVLPGLSVFLMDLRLLPHIDVQQVTAVVNEVARLCEQEYRVQIKVEPHLFAAPPPTAEDAPVAQNLLTALRQSGVQQARFGGIGGGTFASGLRRIGLPCVVWATLDSLAHQPNEYAVIDNLVHDTAVLLAAILMF